MPAVDRIIPENRYSLYSYVPVYHVSMCPWPFGMLQPAITSCGSGAQPSVHVIDSRQALNTLTAVVAPTAQPSVTYHPSNQIKPRMHNKIKRMTVKEPLVMKSRVNRVAISVPHALRYLLFFGRYFKGEIETTEIQIAHQLMYKTEAYSKEYTEELQAKQRVKFMRKLRRRTSPSQQDWIEAPEVILNLKVLPSANVAVIGYYIARLIAPTCLNPKYVPFTDRCPAEYRDQIRKLIPMARLTQPTSDDIRALFEGVETGFPVDEAVAILEREKQCDTSTVVFHPELKPEDCKQLWMLLLSMMHFNPRKRPTLARCRELAKAMRLNAFL